MDFLRWCFAASVDGKRFPLAQWDGKPWPEGNALRNLWETNANLPFRFILVAIKGDWMEYCTTLGFPSWQSFHRPCLFCPCNQLSLYMFAGISLQGHEWGELAPDDYEEVCRKCEVRVTIEFEGIRRAILVVGWGCTLTNARLPKGATWRATSKTWGC